MVKCGTLYKTVKYITKYSTCVLLCCFVQCVQDVVVERGAGFEQQYGRRKRILQRRKKAHWPADVSAFGFLARKEQLRAPLNEAGSHPINCLVQWKSCSLSETFPHSALLSGAALACTGSNGSDFLKIVCHLQTKSLCLNGWLCPHQPVCTRVQACVCVPICFHVRRNVCCVPGLSQVWGSDAHFPWGS